MAEEQEHKAHEDDANDEAAQEERAISFTESELEDFKKRHFGEGAGKAEAKVRRQLKNYGLQSLDDIETLLEKARRVDELEEQRGAEPTKDEEEHLRKEIDARVKAAREADAKRYAEERERIEADKQRALSLAQQFAVEQSIVSAASKHGAIDPQEVAQLTKGMVRLNTEDGVVEVVDPTDPDSPQFADGGKLRSVDDYIAEWLSARPHHVRGDVRTGAGQSASPGGRRTKTHYTRDEIKKLSPEEKDKLMERHARGEVQLSQ